MADGPSSTNNLFLEPSTIFCTQRFYVSHYRYIVLDLRETPSFQPSSVNVSLDIKYEPGVICLITIKGLC